MWDEGAAGQKKQQVGPVGAGRSFQGLQRAATSGSDWLHGAGGARLSPELRFEHQAWLQRPSYRMEEMGPPSTFCSGKGTLSL